MSQTVTSLPRRFSTPQPRVFIALALLLTSLLVLFGSWEYHSYKQQLTRLLQEEALQVSRLVSLGGERIMQASRDWEEQLTHRLLDQARLLDQVERNQELTPQLLAELIPDSSEIRVAIISAAGRWIFPPGGPPPERHGHGPPRREHPPGFQPPDQRPPHSQLPPELKPVLEGKRQMEVLGLGKPHFRRGKRFLLAYHRSRGGAFLLSVDFRHVQQQRQKAGIAGLMERISHRSNVAWVGLYDGNKLLESISRDFPELAQLPPQPGEQAAYIRLEDRQGNTRKILDVTVPLHNPSLEQGLLRVGFTSDQLQISHGIFTRSLLIRSAFFLLIGFLLLYYFLVYSNYRSLQREYESIRAEVARLEQEKQVVNRLQAMGELASGVAHEIRNPLNSIRMVSQRLRLEFAPEGNQEYLQLTRAMQEEADRINRIVTDFLRFARPAPLRLELNSLAECITQTAAALQPGFATAGCTLELNLEDAPVFRFDLDRLSQVIHNLLGNTLQAVDTGGKVTVSVSQTRDHVHITVADDGCGIPPEDRERIFNLYFTTRPEGSGIGLAVTHQIVSEHGGTIRVESEPGAGTVFSVDLPKQQDLTNE